MRKAVLLFLLGISFWACRHAQTVDNTPAELTQQPAAEQTKETPVSPTQKPTKQPAQTSAATPEKQTAKAAKDPVETLPQTATQMQPVVLPPAEQISALRAQQTLAAPAPDTPVFKKEDTISLSGRRLNPFAYEPVVKTKTHAPWSQEELKFGIYYSFIKAGTAYIKNRGLTTVNGKAAYLIQTTAFSSAAIDSVFKVRDVNYSWIDAENFYSLGYTQSLREGNYVRDEWVIFDLPHNRYYGEVQKKGDVNLIEGVLNNPVLDMLSSLYFVRAQALNPASEISLDLVNREEQYPLSVKVLGKETIKTAAGKFHCIVVEPQFRGEGIFVAKGKNLKVWLTDDKYRMPVKMQTEVFIGSVSAELLEYKRN